MVFLCAIQESKSFMVFVLYHLLVMGRLAWTFEFPWPLGAAIGGEVIDRKLIDPDTMLVYANYGVQGHLGPAGDYCKEAGEVIDRWIFKKINGEWKVAEIQEQFDSWQTQVQSDTEMGCESINKGKLKSYKIIE
jgi:hypothetical protein